MTKLIAEIGINHGGDMDLAKRLIDGCKDAKADIAKFQWYRPLELLGPNNPNLEEAVKCQFTEEQHKELKAYCDKVGIEWSISIFHADLVDKVEDMGIKTYKIGSRAALDDELLSAISKTHKPVIISTGLINNMQLRNIVNEFRDCDLTLLYCLPRYPTKPKDICLACMLGLKEFNRPVGLSSHCPNIVPTLAAVHVGASVIEHHVTIDKDIDGCDISSSLSFGEFGAMALAVRAFERLNETDTSFDIGTCRMVAGTA